MSEASHKLAVFIDVDNAFPRFSHESLRCLFDRLAGIGTVQLCRAYADWNALGSRTRETMRWAVTPVHLYTHGVQRKNAADIAMAVDAMEAMHLNPRLDTFVLVTGDADLAPLATRLRERGMDVIGFGRRARTSPFLVRSCQRFEYLDDIENDDGFENQDALTTARIPITDDQAPSQAVFHALDTCLDALESEGALPVNAGQLKAQVLQLLPHFREKDHGAKTFVTFLEAHAAELALEVERTSAGPVRVHRRRARGHEEVDDGGDSTLDLEAARDLLVRALNARESTDGSAPLSWLKSTMQRISPSFSERSLGFARFRDFVREQHDLVLLSEDGEHRWSVRLLGAAEPNPRQMSLLR